ncbi:N-acetylneuraminate synthase family protein [Candidatus Pelagibacter sp.]|nr:N-acetylneuraminate synthase family protein [Candidatus Pelagibacter sp.]
MNGIYFIAEIGVNHEAKIESAFKHIIAAKKGGAQAIKLQVYKAEKIVSKYAKAYWDKSVEKEDSQMKLYKKLDKFELSDYEKIYKFCKKIKIDFLITPFDLDSIDFFKKKVNYFKISSSDITNYALLNKIASTKKKIILSTGASTKNEIKNAIKILKKTNNKICLLHCILNYPTKIYNANLNMIDDIKKFGYEVGLSDHTLPSDSHKVLPIAYAKGVRIIEKHFTLNKRKKGNDHFHSFDKNDLLKFFRNINNLKKILGSENKTFIKSEIISRKNARRSIFYKKNLRKGHTIRKEDLIMLRPNIGVCASKIDLVIGKKIKVNRKKNGILRFSDLKK